MTRDQLLQYCRAGLQSVTTPSLGEDTDGNLLQMVICKICKDLEEYRENNISEPAMLHQAVPSTASRLFSLLIVCRG